MFTTTMAGRMVSVTTIISKLMVTLFVYSTECMFEHTVHTAWTTRSNVWTYEFLCCDIHFCLKIQTIIYNADHNIFYEHTVSSYKL